ncbi:YkoF family thiamine/hydroxymethylpyrimidine-binding protein [Glaciibacter superstes]|uniref:YkoF family thiamine/hydroxymethylpyrimidine-binding protein n=1 Tax=Glaciibacter superstes TaxID=501023 RepID=UPI0003B5468F|nr:YkoF family thiamine/hydroxymethylpyrimidine-binding protein [Glaciibacter superstes]
MHTTTPTSQASTTLVATPREFGVGARLTLSVMSDDYVNVILSAIRAADATGLATETGAVSTYVSGGEADILRYLSQVISAAGRAGHHVSASLLLSRGCPGEATCELPAAGAALYSEISELPPTGVHAVGEWALYPLADVAAASVDGNAAPDHMRDIYAAIDYAKSTGISVHTEHFVTRLEGDLAQVLQAIAAGWILVGRTVQHVATHATVSINSPSSTSPAAAAASSS